MRSTAVVQSSFKRSHRRECGATIINLLVTISIVGIVGFIGLPQLSRISASFDRLNSRTIFIQDLKQAQAKALTEGCRGIFTFSESGNSYSFGCDYLPYDLGEPPTADTVAFVRFLPTGIQITPSTQIIFNSRGLPVDPFDVINNVTVTFTDVEESGTFQFASGTLFGTGLFSFG